MRAACGLAASVRAASRLAPGGAGTGGARAMHSLPVVDVSPFVLNQADKKQAVAEELHRVCTRVGFFYVQGHGVSQQLIDDVVGASFEFFHKPQAAKEAIKMRMDANKVGIGRGYQKLGENVTLGKRDWHEGLDLYPDLPPSHPLVQAHPLADPNHPANKPHPATLLQGKNLLPSDPPHFRALCDQYVKEMLRVGRSVMAAMAVSLGLHEDYFEQQGLTNDPYWVMRFIGYPPLPHAPADCNEKGVSCGEHTDYGCLTILYQNDANPNALQVRNVHGEWVHASPQPGCYVVNIGDAWTTWTRGLYKSTPHRVVHAGDKYRISIPFFFEPNFEARIAPLPAESIRGQDGGQFPAYVQGDHLLGKVHSNFELLD